MSRSINPEDSVRKKLGELLDYKIALLDGAMGTMIQQYDLQENDYRGERFADWPSDLKGNNDLLTLTQPQIISSIHQQYLAAGANIIETNTFNANAPSMAVLLPSDNFSPYSFNCFSDWNIKASA